MLLNCLVHRDYSFSGSTLVNIYDNRIEFISLGGLVTGLKMETIFIGVSQTRNPALAAVFYRLRLIESFGTGIEKIQQSYLDTMADKWTVEGAVKSRRREYSATQHQR